MKRLIIALILVVCFGFSTHTWAKTYNIGDAIEVAGVMKESYGVFYMINVDCIDIHVEPAILKGSVGLPKGEGGKCDYWVLYGGGFDNHYNLVRNFNGEYDLKKFDGKKVRLNAKIVLCDKCNRVCSECNLCCIFYLEPIKIEILDDNH